MVVINQLIKVFIAGILLLCLPLIVQSQEADNSSRNEISIGVGHSFGNFIVKNNVSSSGGLYTGVRLKNEPAVRIAYKHHIGEASIRIGASGNIQNVKDPAQYSMDEQYTSYNKFQSRYFDCSAGIELDKLIHGFNIYVGSDLIYRNYALDVRAEIENAAVESVLDVTRRSIGVAPLAGITFKITKSISMNLEAKALVEYAKGVYSAEVSSSYLPQISRINYSGDYGAQINGGISYSF